MNYSTRQNNSVTLSGTIVTNPQFSHELYGEKFFEIMLCVKRLSSASDLLPVCFSERLAPMDYFEIGKEITVLGQFRSYNKLVDNHSKLMLCVFVKEVSSLNNDVNPNLIELSGYICKPPVFRTTPFGREICDLLLAVNRAYNKSDYVPCIAWGRNARFVSGLPVGEAISISGRVQSRQYQKKLSETEVQTKTAYEVSVSKVALGSDCKTTSELYAEALNQ